MTAQLAGTRAVSGLGGPNSALPTPPVSPALSAKPLPALTAPTAPNGQAANPPANPLAAPPQLLLDSPTALPRLEDAIRGAKHVIDISMYSWLATGSGAELAQVVEQKAREGVEVNVMLDEEGSLLVPGSSSYVQVQAMRAAGVHVVENMSLLGAPVDHTKSYIIDGRSGFLGGMNLSATYDKWHDAMVTLDQSDAIAAGRDFLMKWKERGGTVSAENYAEMHPTTAPASNGDSRVLPNHPHGNEQVTEAYLNQIAHAKTRIWVESPFLGSQKLVTALEAAARRGVDVRVVTDGESTHDHVKVIPLEGESFYAQLMRAGVKVYEQKQMTHTKLLLADDTVTTGSFNLTKRSQQTEYEIDMQTTDPQFIDSVEHMFASDLAVAKQITHADLQKPLAKIVTWLQDTIHYHY